MEMGRTELKMRQLRNGEKHPPLPATLDADFHFWTTGTGTWQGWPAWMGAVSHAAVLTRKEGASVVQAQWQSQFSTTATAPTSH